MTDALWQAIKTQSIDQPVLNIRAGIAYLFTRMAYFATGTVRDSDDTRIYVEVIRHGDSLEKIARRVGTTVEILASMRKESTSTVLRVGEKLQYYKACQATVIQRWRPWDYPTIADRYNGEVILPMPRSLNMSTRYCSPSWYANWLGILAGIALFGGHAAYANDWDALARIQGKVYAALRAQGVADTARTLVHVSHTCEVNGGGRLYHVVEIRELVKGGPSPRGVNQLVILDRRLRVVARLELGSARPYYCTGDAVVLNQPIDIPESGATANVLHLNGAGRLTGFDTKEASELTGFRPGLP